MPDHAPRTMREMMPPRLIAAPLLFAAAVVLAAEAGAAAQDDGVYTSQVSVPEDRNGLQLVTDADHAARTQDWTRWARLLQDAVNRFGAKMVTVEPGQHMSLRDFCFRKIAAAPPEALAAYRRVFDAWAEELWTDALARRDPAPLDTIFANYWYTDFGPRAALAAADLALERMDPETALLVLARHERRFATDPTVLAPALARRVFALWLLGRTDGIADVAESAGAATLAVTVRFLGEPCPLSDIVARFLRPGPPAPRPTGVDPALFDAPAWSAAVQLGLQQGGHTFLTGLGGETPFAPVIPAVDGASLYYQDGLRVFGRNIFTGGDKWNLPGDAVRGAVDRSQGRPNRNVILPVTVSDGLVFAFLETPVADPGEDTFFGYTPVVAIPARRLVAVDGATGRILWRHGARTGPAAGGAPLLERLNINTAPLAIGDRLYVAGTVYRGNYHHYLVCLDKWTGSLLWSTFVAFGQNELNMFGNPIKESIPSPVAESDGVLYFSTNLGVVAAVEAATGSPLWISEYEQIPMTIAQSQMTFEREPGFMNRAPVIAGDRVIAAPMDSYEVCAFEKATGRRTTLARMGPGNRYRYLAGTFGDAVILAGRRIGAHEIATGRIRWQQDVSGGSGIGVEGMPAIAGDRLVFTARNRRGDNALLMVDLVTGKLVEERPLRGRHRAGNILLAEDAAVISGEREVTCFFLPAAVEKRLEAAVAAAPDDPAPRLRLGELHLQKDDLPGALAHFEAAWERAGPGRHAMHRDAARAALHRIWLDLAARPRARLVPAVPERERFARALEYAHTPEERVDVLFRLLARDVLADAAPSARRVAAQILAEEARTPASIPPALVPLLPEGFQPGRHPAGLIAALAGAGLAERAADGKAVVRHLQSLIRDFPAEPVGTGSAWRHAHDRIATLIARSGAAVYAEEEARARALLAEASRSGLLAPLQQILEHYPNAPVVDEAYLRVSETLVRNRDITGAIRNIHQFLCRFRKPTAAVLLLLADCLLEVGAPASARDVLEIARSRHGSDPVTPGAEGGAPKAARDAAAERLERSDIRDAGRADPPLPEVSLTPREIWSAGAADDPEDVVLVVPEGPRPAGLAGRFLYHRAGYLVCSALAADEVVWRRAAAAPPRQCLAADERLLLVAEREIVAAGAADGREIWRLPLPDHDVFRAGAGHGRVYALLRGRTVDRGFDLVCLDLVSGERLWAAAFPDGHPGLQSPLVGTGLVAIVSGAPAAVTAFDALTGEQVGEPVPILGQDAVLNAADDLVAVRRGTPDPVQEAAAVDLRTGKVRWSHVVTREPDADAEVLRATPSRIALKVTRRTASTGPTASRRSLAILDADTGLRLFARDFSATENPKAADTVLRDDEAFLELVRTTDRGNTLVEYEHIDLRSGATTWKTLPFSGWLLLRVVPARPYVLCQIIQQVPRNGRVSQESRLHFIDARTGASKETLDLSPVRYTTHRIVHAADGHLVLALGPVLKVLKS